MSANGVTIILTPLLRDSVGRRTLHLSPGQSCKPIGRSSQVDSKDLHPAWHNCWFENRVLSRVHAEFQAVTASKDVYLVDKKSLHGTCVNGRKLMAGEKAKLLPNDILTLGATVNRGPEFFEPVQVRFHVQWWHGKGPANEGVQYRHPKRISPNTFVVPDNDDEEDNEPGDSDEEDQVMVVDEKAAATKPASDPVEQGPAKDDGDLNHNPAAEDAEDPGLESDKDDESDGEVASIHDDDNDDNASPPPYSDVGSDSSDAMSPYGMKSSPLTSSPHVDNSDLDGDKRAMNQRDEKSPSPVSEEGREDEMASVDPEADESTGQSSRHDAQDGTNKNGSVRPGDDDDDDDDATGGNTSAKDLNPRPVSRPAGQHNEHREATISSSVPNPRPADVIQEGAMLKPVPKPWEIPPRARAPAPQRRHAPGLPERRPFVWPQAPAHTPPFNGSASAADFEAQRFLGQAAPSFEPPPPPEPHHVGVQPSNYHVPPMPPVLPEHLSMYRGPGFDSIHGPAPQSSSSPVCPAPAGGYPGHGPADVARREWLATRLDCMMERMNDYDAAVANDQAKPGPLSVSRSDPRAILQEHGDGGRSKGNNKNNTLKRKREDTEATSSRATDLANVPPPSPVALEKGIELPDQVEQTSSESLASGETAQVPQEPSEIDVDGDQQPPRKKTRTTGPRSSVSRYAATALAGAVVGGVGAVVALATLPVGYFD